MSSEIGGVPKPQPREERARETRAADAKAHTDAMNGLLWEAYLRDPCDEHRNLLVEAHQNLVRDIVRRFASRLPRNIDRGDLQTAANVGLMNAIGGFYPERGVRFSSYCERRVKGALLDELRSQDWLPRPWRQKIEQHKRVLEGLRAEHDREPLDSEVAEAMEMSLEEYELIFGTGLPGAPAGSMPGSEGGEDVAHSLDVVPDQDGDAPGDKLTRDEILRLVAQRLSELEYRIVYLKYWEELPMREIGEITGLSESRVCKIHARLLERLKDRFRVQQPEE